MDFLKGIAACIALGWAAFMAHSQAELVRMTANVEAIHRKTSDAWWEAHQQMVAAPIVSDYPRWIDTLPDDPHAYDPILPEPEPPKVEAIEPPAKPVSLKQFGPRAAPGFRAPTIIVADELHLRGPGGLWKVTIGPRGALYAVPVNQNRPQGWPGGKRW